MVDPSNHSMRPPRAGPRVIGGEELTRWRSVHPSWSTDGHRLQRVVGLPGLRLAPLNREFEVAQRMVNHRGVLRQTEDGFACTLSTTSVDRVTELDLQLAALVDDMVEAIGSGG
ncbi:hypothetical protein [Mycobacterium sp. URHB0044]|uniref:hypothetical protein n=1 Tax=Mycobacterium sp. URHB0044 TaxID=1380386 RepID=UPI00048F831C|nr:hypothetical protein [Mycobacterium sp. URHB0044]